MKFKNWGLPLSIIWCITFIYFYKTSFQFIDFFPSDIPAHIIVSKYMFDPQLSQMNIFPHIEGYMLYHFIVKCVSVFCLSNYEIASSIVLATCVILTFVLLVKLFEKLYNTKCTNQNKLIIIGLIFISSIPLLGKLYLPYGTGNVWHNPTYLIMKPLGLLTLVYYCNIFKSEKKANKNIALFSIFSLLMTYAKPSFTIVLLPVAGVYMCYYLIKQRFINIGLGLKVLGAVIPTLLLLLYQYSIGMGNNVNIILSPGGFQQLNLFKIIVCLFSALLLPIIIYGIEYNNNDLIHKLSFSCILFSAFQYFVFDTYPISGGDFAWGYFCSIFIFNSLMVFKLIKLRNNNLKSTLIVLYLFQVTSGLFFFVLQFNMSGYYI